MEESDLQALERFVADNDELLQLEARIAKFNIFDALRLERAEIRHSNFLAWLLTPTESHGQGDVFLKALLIDLVRRANRQSTTTGLSVVDLDGENIAYAEVLREDGHTDLLIRIHAPPCVVCIENKMHKREDAAKLEKYAKHVAARFPNTSAVFVFLNPEGDEPPDNRWIPYGYDDVHTVFKRVLDRKRQHMASDVAIFVEHYLGLLESEFMTDAHVTELCKRIYANHRQAIDLIFEHANVSGQGVLGTVADEIEKLAGGPWTFVNRSGRWLRVVPDTWRQATSQIESRMDDPRLAVFYEIYASPKDIRVSVVVGPIKDLSCRSQLIERLTSKPEEFGLRLMKGKGAPSPQWTRIASQSVYKWDPDEGPDQDEATTRTLNVFRQLHAQSRAIGIAIADVCSKWMTKANRAS